MTPETYALSLAQNWTLEEHERAVTLWKSGASVTRVARIMGRTRGSVAGKLRRSGVLGNMVRTQGTRSLKTRWNMPPRITKIVNDLSAAKRVPVSEVLSNSVNRHVTAARHEIMLYLRDHVVMMNGSAPSYPIIGRWFGRDHSSVIYGIRQARSRVA